MRKNMDKVDKASRLASFYYLIFLFSLFTQPGFDPNAGLLDWLTALVLVAVFLPFYFRAYWRGGRDMARGLAVTLTLGVLGSFFNTGATVFYIYAAAMAALAFRPQEARSVLMALVAIVTLQAVLVAAFIFPEGMPYVLIPFAFALVFILLVGNINIYEAEKRRADARLRLAQDEVESLATIAERERIARDLHDLLGHTLSMITLKAELASKLAERDPVRAAKEMREVETISRETLSEVRAAVQGYRSRGFKSELATAKLAFETASIKLDYYLEPLELAPTVESVLALALREAVTNVLRHSGAKHCSVRLANQDQRVVLEVRDDGRGGITEEGSGLQGMRERVTALGGSLELSSNHGTTLRVMLPHHEPLTSSSSGTRTSWTKVEAG